MGAREETVGARLRRDLGALESYAALIGMLVGAGIFRVTSDASALTGPSVIAGHLVLAVAMAATAVPYMVFLSTPLGAGPGGEYTHLRATFGSQHAAFVGAWLKIVSYVGAGTYLAVALADYAVALLAIAGLELDPDAARVPLAAGALVFFLLVHLFGVRWFGRVQVAMCVVLGVSIVVLVVPGLFAVEAPNYRPFFRNGPTGFAAALPALFFSWAGFESLAHSGGEVRDATRQLPRAFLRGIAATALIFVSMSAVSFGVLPTRILEQSTAPMADVAAVYLPAWGTGLVAVGGVMAVATSLNATLYVPARLALQLAEHGSFPRTLGRLHPSTGTPVIGLLLTFGLALGLLLTGQFGLALSIAVFSLVSLYGLHSVALLCLPRRNPELYASVTARVPRPLQVAAGSVSVAAMGGLLVVQAVESFEAMGRTPFLERWGRFEPSTLELFAVWALLGTAVAVVAARRRGRR